MLSTADDDTKAALQTVIGSLKSLKDQLAVLGYNRRDKRECKLVSIMDEFNSYPICFSMC